MVLIARRVVNNCMSISGNTFIYITVVTTTWYVYFWNSVIESRSLGSLFLFLRAILFKLAL